MEQVKSVPDLCLYSFTNNKYQKRPILPHHGMEIIRQRTVSSNIRKTKKPPKKTFTGITQDIRPLSTKPRFHSTKGFVTRVQTPAYTLTQSASAVEMKINVKEFFEPPKFSPTVEKLIGSCICKQHGKIIYNEKLKEPLDIIQRITIESIEKEEELQKEIVEMSISARKQKEQYELQIEELTKEKDKMAAKYEKQHTANQKFLKGLHDKEIQTIRKQCQDDLCQQKLLFLAEKEQHNIEIKEYKKLVQETKRELKNEAEVRLKALEKSLKEEYDGKVAGLQNKIKAQRNIIAEEVKEEISRMYDSEIEKLIEKYESQIKNLKIRDTLANELGEEVVALKSDLKQRNETIKRLRDEVESVTAEKRNEELKLLQTSRELKELQLNFSDKLQTFKSKYIEQWDDLRLENSQLRGRIIELSEESSRHHSDLNRFNVHGLPRRLRLATALKARQLANLSLVKNDANPLEESFPRCTSAPGTNKEARSVETNAFKKQARELSRPCTTYIRK